MRSRLSSLIAQAALDDPKVIVLSGDHGYALFDALRAQSPDQFLNCGIAEQGMIGIAAGLAQQGFKPIVYGLAAFIPMRTLEQIKLDVCFSNLPVIFLGDGAGLVYSTLGASHHCSEDIAVLRPLPNISIYSPCDADEIEACFHDALIKNGPSYIRIGKSDRPIVSQGRMASPCLQYTHISPDKETCIVATGSMVAVATDQAKTHNLDCVSVARIKPVSAQLIQFLSLFKTIITLEEHSKHGGLYSSIAEEFSSHAHFRPRIIPLALKDQFADKCGSYQYALSEHDMDDESIRVRIRTIIN